MRILSEYSHLNGLEYLIVHHPKLLDEIREAIASVDAEECRTKVSKEKGQIGKLLYSPVDMNLRIAGFLNSKGWDERRTAYWVTQDADLIRQTMSLETDEQKMIIERSGEKAIYSYNQTDFVKNRIAVEVQFGKYSFVAYDLFVKHMAFFVGDVIDLGVEILPMKSLTREMSSGVAYYEGELYNVIRQGRGTPAVPLVLLGVAP